MLNQITHSIRVFLGIRWNHYAKSEFGQLHDDLLRAEMNYDDVSFVFQYCR